jgi:hypothetical protein
VSYAIRSAACLAPWGDGAVGLPGAAPVELPPVPGFAISRFSPLVWQVVRRCLGTPGGEDDLIGKSGAGTAIVLGTIFGDTTTGDTHTRRLIAGQVHNPVLFFQSVTTSVLGYVGREYGISGPVTCLSAAVGLDEQLLTAADLLLIDDEVEQVLVVGVELAGEEETRRRFELATDGLDPACQPQGDVAVALLVTRSDNGATPTAEPASAAFGWLRGLVGLSDAVGRTHELAGVR